MTERHGLAPIEGRVWGDVEVVSCPLCGADREASRPFHQGEDGGRLLRYAYCGRCGFVFQAPRPSESKLADYYSKAYHAEMASDEEGDRRNAWVQGQRAEGMLEFLREHVDRVERHLDVGCSRGTLMRVVAEHYGGEAVGVEPGETHRELARAQGLEVVDQLDEVDPEYRSSMDLVSLSHVLEHVASPREQLADLRETWLSHEGYLLVEVPSLYWHPSFERAHLGAFTASSLRFALEAAGFEIVALQAHGQPYSRTIPLFLLALARPSAGPRTPRPQPAHPALLKLRRAGGLLLLRAARWGAQLLRPAEAMSPWSATD